MRICDINVYNVGELHIREIKNEDKHKINTYILGILSQVVKTDGSIIIKVINERRLSEPNETHVCKSEDEDEDVEDEDEGEELISREEVFTGGTLVIRHGDNVFVTIKTTTTRILERID